MTQSRKRCVVLCPGRGSYSKETLNSLQTLVSPKLDAADSFRNGLGRPTVREMDASPKFRSSWHIAGENASCLTAGASAADFDQLSSNIDIVGMCGNSMGWYTALGLSGALPFGEMLRLIETMGQYQKGNVVGGQIVYSLVDENWCIDPNRIQLVNEVVDEIPDLYWSIHLGGQAVLGGTTEALNEAMEKLPTVEGPRPFPFKLPLHSAFHTPLMLETHRRALRDLTDLGIRTPSVPIIDGTGKLWRPQACSPVSLLEYTLGAQVTEAYDFTAMIRSTLTQLAPDHIILLGPGSNLGGAVAHVLIAEQWQGIQSKEDFVVRQRENPFILAMGRAEQRAMVTQ